MLTCLLSVGAAGDRSKTAAVVDSHPDATGKSRIVAWPGEHCKLRRRAARSTAPKGKDCYPEIGYKAAALFTEGFIILPAQKNKAPSIGGLELQAGVRAGSRYIYELECVRGLAISLVFLFHVYGISTGPEAAPPGLAMSFIVSGNTGVTLFFVLSGFLLSRPWFRSLQEENRPPPSVRNYYVARILRILPLYWVAVVFAMAVSGNWQDGLQAMAFGFVGFDIFPYSVVWWTLSTEVQFYLLLPLVMAGWVAGRWWRALVIAGLAGWLFWYSTHVLFPDANIANSFLLTKSVLARLPAFLAGIFACWIYLRLDHRRFTSRQSAALSLLVTTVLLVTLGLVLREVAHMGDRTAEATWHIHHAYEALLWAALLLVLLMGNPPGRALLVNRAMATLGKLSYSVYLNHVPILFFMIYPVQQSLGKAGYADSAWLYILPVVAFALSTLLGYVTYRLVELPFLGMKHRLSV